MSEEGIWFPYLLQSQFFFLRCAYKFFLFKCINFCRPDSYYVSFLESVILVYMFADSYFEVLCTGDCRKVLVYNNTTEIVFPKICCVSYQLKATQFLPLKIL